MGKTVYWYVRPAPSVPESLDFDNNRLFLSPCISSIRRSLFF